MPEKDRSPCQTIFSCVSKVWEIVETQTMLPSETPDNWRESSNNNNNNNNNNNTIFLITIII